MKRIYIVLLVAIIAGAGSCELPSNAKYTGNYYSSTKQVHKKQHVQQNATGDMAMTPAARTAHN